MRQIDGEKGVLAVMFLVLVGGAAPGCERGGDEAPGSEAETPAAEASDEESSGGETPGAAAEASGESSGEASGADDREAAGDPLPALKARTVEGSTVTIQPKSKATLVNLWATWCSPCIAELPEFKQLGDAWGDRGLRLVGLSIQDEDAEQRVAEFVDEREMPFDQVLYAPEHDPLEVLGGGAVPSTFLYDADGHLVWWHGSMLKEPQLEELGSHLEDLLGSAAN